LKVVGLLAACILFQVQLEEIDVPLCLRIERILMLMCLLPRLRDVRLGVLAKLPCYYW